MTTHRRSVELTMFLWAGGAGRGIPTRRAGASPVIMFLAPRTGGETPRQAPQSVNSTDLRVWMLDS